MRKWISDMKPAGRLFVVGLLMIWVGAAFSTAGHGSFAFAGYLSGTLSLIGSFLACMDNK